MPNLLTYDEVYNLLKEIVDEKGESYLYTEDPETVAKRNRNAAATDSCYYGGADSKTPGCIVGHLAHKLSPETNLDMLDGYGAVGAMRAIGFPVNAHSKAAVLLGKVQSAQDNGATWGEALTHAKAVADNYDESHL